MTFTPRETRLILQRLSRVPYVEIGQIGDFSGDWMRRVLEEEKREEAMREQLKRDWAVALGVAGGLALLFVVLVVVWP